MCPCTGAGIRRPPLQRVACFAPACDPCQQGVGGQARAPVATHQHLPVVSAPAVEQNLPCQQVGRQRTGRRGEVGRQAGSRRAGKWAGSAQHHVAIRCHCQCAQCAS